MINKKLMTKEQNLFFYLLKINWPGLYICGTCQVSDPFMYHVGTTSTSFFIYTIHQNNASILHKICLVGQADK